MLNAKGDIYQYAIDKDLDQETKEIIKVKINNQPRKIASLSNIKQIDVFIPYQKKLQTGDDHFVALSNTGEVFTMGDDTLGQCG